ncbi:alpha/beta fold hydrolase [Nocardioides sp. LHG3406-4]|uniref:alpha/beta fold hydrolase n=1 Tax=Nocardioides sp. LHG3406-4 TaxID=2804575 RepID=UPI003CE7994E
MADLDLTFSHLAGTVGQGPLLVLGPSLGTSVGALWAQAASHLGDRFEVVGWDLPGHGRSKAATEPFAVSDLAGAVRKTTGQLAGAEGRRVAYAGVSMGGAVALQLALEPGPFSQVACIAGAAKIGESAMWRERGRLVRTAGTPIMVAGSAERWFAPGYIERNPETANQLLLSLMDADRDSYALACDALAEFDVRDRLGEARVPVLAMAGELDVVVPTSSVREVADAVPDGEFSVATGCGHLPAAEDPAGTAAALLSHLRSAHDH